MLMFYILTNLLLTYFITCPMRWSDDTVKICEDEEIKVTLTIYVEYSTVIQLVVQLTVNQSRATSEAFQVGYQRNSSYTLHLN